MSNKTLDAKVALVTGASGGIGTAIVKRLAEEAARCIEDGGRIINITSSTTVYPGAGQAVYAASKAAVRIFTQVLAQELGKRQITVNSVVPGPTSPGMFDNAPPEHQKIAAQSSPLGRLGTPEDIAEVVVFLASDKARWLTRQDIVTNGGAKI